MEEYAGRVLADRYRLPLAPADPYAATSPDSTAGPAYPAGPTDLDSPSETRAFDTYSGQEVLVRQVPLPEVVEAEVVGPDGRAVAHGPGAGGRAGRRGITDPLVRRAIDAAQSAAQVPDHPRLDQVFDVFAQDGSLWIVSELVAARPLAALVAERPLNPYRAAEIASDLLTAVRVLHGHGWVHRNITVRTVLVCDDGRVVLTGLAAGAAEEALCGYAPVPEPPSGPGPGGAREQSGVHDARQDPAAEDARQPEFAPPPPAAPGYELPTTPQDPRDPYGNHGQFYGPARTDPDATGNAMSGPPAGNGPTTAGVPAPQGHAAFGGESPYGSGAGTGPGPGAASGPGTSSGTSGALPRPPRQQSTPGVPAPYGGPNSRPALPAANSASEAVRAARAGAIAAYRAGARAAARASEEEQAHAQQRQEPFGQEPQRQQPLGQAPQGPEPQRQDQLGQEPQRQQPLGHGPQGQDQLGQGPRGHGQGQSRHQSQQQPQEPQQAQEPQQPQEPQQLQQSPQPQESQQPPQPQHQGQPPAAGKPWGAPGSDQAPLPGGAAPGGPATGPAVGPHGPGPDWWSQPPAGFGDPDGDSDAEGDDDDPLPYRRNLAGTWRDGPAPWNDSSGGVPAGGGGDADRPRTRTPALPAGFTPAGSERNDALRADARRDDAQGAGDRDLLRSGPGQWGELVPAGAPGYGGGPATALAAERARQARIAVVGAVTERWAPEQAGPVHENWQLAAPIGPATDLWALGALLYRVVQGHAPYPEDSAAELVELVCSEPPAFAEECGPLRPVVESLLRQDPTERPDFEELRGWLRSLVRSAPEPDAGEGLVSVPTVDGRLPIKRRKGELVRKRRFWGRRKPAEHETERKHRHKRGRGAVVAGAVAGGAAGAVGPYAYAEQASLTDRPRDSLLPPERGGAAGAPDHEGGRAGGGPAGGDDLYGGGPEESGYAGTSRRSRQSTQPKPSKPPKPSNTSKPPKTPKTPKTPKQFTSAKQQKPSAPGKQGRGPRTLGRTLLIIILLVLVAAIVYAVKFMPKSEGTEGQRVREASAGSSAAAAPPSPAPAASGGGSSAAASDSPDRVPATGGKGSPTGAPTVAVGSGTHLAKGYVLRKDPEGFQIAVRQDWRRRPMNDSGQVRYVSGDFTLIVVPGRDTVKADGSDPLAYQSDKEPELQPFRASTWASASGLRRIDVGRQAMAEGQYTWQDSNGRTVYVRNLAMILDGRYHVVQVIGPDGQRDEVSEIYQQATASYKTVS